MKKIVLIEDNPDVRETTKEILELADYCVLDAENGKSGVNLVKQNMPDLVICDIMMPDLDGYGVLHILSKHPETSGIPFIFLTAKAEKGDIRKGMNLGADDYLTKPFEEAELLKVVEVRLQRNERLKQHTVANHESLSEFMNEARGLEELSNLTDGNKIRKYPKKESIYREGDYANYLYFIVQGRVKCVKTDTYNKDFVSSIYGKGEFLGYTTLLEGTEYYETAITIEPTTVSMVPKQDFLNLIYKNRDVAARFIKLLSGNVKDREKRLLQLAYAPLRERIADALLNLTNSNSGLYNADAPFRIAREDLANIVGTAKESLIRTLSQLKKEGLLNTNGQEIEILDKKGLEKAATGF